MKMYAYNAADAYFCTSVPLIKRGYMKKLLLAFLASVGLCACSGLNKNTVSYQTAKYDTAKYYVVAGEGMTKEEASQNALTNMRREMIQNAPDAAEQGVVPDLMANASVDKVWRDADASSKHYYALAVLPRANARKVLEPLLKQADLKLAGLSAQFASPADPMADLKIAYKMQPVVLRRQALDDLYQFLSADRESFEPANFLPYKNALKEKLAAVLVAVDVEGVQSEVFVTYVVDALNQMGLGVADIADPDRVILVKVVTETDGYNSKKVEGLVWCSSGAAVSLADAQRNVTFARFNVHERAGTSRAADSMRRSMQAAGEQAAKQITQRLETYLKTR